MRRDRVTFGMMIGLPLMQLFLFGFAINADPRHLPTLVEMGDNGPLTRAVIAGMRAIGLFRFPRPGGGHRGGRGGAAARRGQFRRRHSAEFRARRGARARAEDPRRGRCVRSLGGGRARRRRCQGIVNVAVAQVLTGPLAPAASTPPFSVIVHREYNPEGKTSTNIVPGLLAIILSMTMVMITAVAIVKETERGTMEMLIATPVRPFEVMLGKILPYVFVGYVQTMVFLASAYAGVPRAVRRQLGGVLSRLQPLHRGQPGARLPDLDGGAQPDAGDAAELFHHPALDPAVGLHVPVRRHAGLGAVPRHRACRRRISCASSAR